MFEGSENIKRGTISRRARHFPRETDSFPSNETTDPPPTMNIQKMMKQAQKMQEQMQRTQEELAQRTIEATAGGGKITVVASGAGDVLSIKISKDVVDPNDVEMLEDLVLTGVQKAIANPIEAYGPAIAKAVADLKAAAAAETTQRATRICVQLHPSPCSMRSRDMRAATTATSSCSIPRIRRRCSRSSAKHFTPHPAAA